MKGHIVQFPTAASRVDHKDEAAKQPTTEGRSSSVADLAVGYGLGLMMMVPACIGTTGQDVAVALAAVIALALMVLTVGFGLLLNYLLPPEDTR